MWWKARHSLGMPGQPVTMPDEKAEQRDLHRAAEKMRRHASLIVFVEINCFLPGDPQQCASQGVQLSVAAATPVS